MNRVWHIAVSRVCVTLCTVMCCDIKTIFCPLNLVVWLPEPAQNVLQLTCDIHAALTHLNSQTPRRS